MASATLSDAAGSQAAATAYEWGPARWHAGLRRRGFLRDERAEPAVEERPRGARHCGALAGVQGREQREAGTHIDRGRRPEGRASGRLWPERDAEMEERRAEGAVGLAVAAMATGQKVQAKVLEPPQLRNRVGQG